MDFFYNSWIANNSDAIVVSFIAGIATSFVIKLTSTLREIIRFVFQTKESIDGHWISSFPGTNEYPVYEIIKVNSSKEKVRISYQSYKFLNGEVMTVRSGYGVGVRNVGTIVCPYNRIKPPSAVLGTYLLNDFIYNQELCLVGYYVQREDDTKDSIYDAGPMTFIKISIPFLRRLRTVYRPLFKSNNELIKYLSNEAKHIIDTSNRLRINLPPISQDQLSRNFRKVHR